MSRWYCNEPCGNAAEPVGKNSGISPVPCCCDRCSSICRACCEVCRFLLAVHWSCSKSFMLLLFESTTSCASVLAWLPDAPPNVVPLGNVMVWGFCSSGCCITNCCGGGCAHPPSAAANTRLRTLTVPLFIRLLLTVFAMQGSAGFVPVRRRINGGTNWFV